MPSTPVRAQRHPLAAAVAAAVDVVLRQLEVAAAHRAAGRDQRAVGCDGDRAWVVRHRGLLEARWSAVAGSPS